MADRARTLPQRVWSSWWLPVGITAWLFLVALTAIPFLITFDGHYYLSGSRVLFTDQAPDLVWWLRQPGYSVFLRLLASGLSPSDLWVTAVQAGFVLIGSALAASSVWQSLKGRGQIPAGPLALCLLVGAGNAGVLLYSSAALQQSIFVLATGIALRLSVSLQLRPSWALVLGSLALVMLVALVQMEFARLMGLVLGVGVVLSSIHPSTRRRGDDRPLWMRSLAAALIILVLQLAVSLVLAPWDDYKSREMAERSSHAPVLLESFPSLRQQLETASSGEEPHEKGLLSQLGAYVGLRGSTQVASEPVEREIYVENRTNTEWNCGAVEGMPPEFRSVYTTSMSGVDVTCRSVAAMEFWAPYVHGTLDLYPYLLVAGLLVAFLQLGFGRAVVPAATVVGLTAAYTALGFGADRYSVPIFPTATAILIVTTFTSWESWAARRRKSS